MNAVYVEEAQTRELVKVKHVTEFQGERFLDVHSVVIWLEDVQWTRTIRIYLTAATVCTVAVDGGRSSSVDRSMSDHCDRRFFENYSLRT